MLGITQTQPRINEAKVISPKREGEREKENVQGRG